MLTVLKRGATAFVTLADGDAIPTDAAWIELITPTRDEELAVEKAPLGLGTGEQHVVSTLGDGYAVDRGDGLGGGGLGRLGGKGGRLGQQAGDQGEAEQGRRGLH